MYEINRDKQLELLRWLLTTLDAQWLTRTAAVYNPAEASKLNGRVRSAMGRTEMKAVLSLLGKSKADNLVQAAEMVQAYIGLAYGERGFSGTFRPVQQASGQQRLEIEVVRFTALDAIKKVAQASGERPGLATEAFWSAWFETLLPDEQVEISVQSGSTGPDLITVTAYSDSFAVAPEPAEEISPIAAALQIPIEQVKPAPTTEPAPIWPPSAPPSGPAPAQVDPSSEARPGTPPGYPFTSGYVFKPGAEPAPIGYDGPVEAPLPPNALPKEKPPLVGAPEPGADRKAAGSLNQRLAARSQGQKPPDKLPPEAPPALQNEDNTSSAPLPAPAAALRINPATGRPLFSEDPDELARRSVEKRKNQKGLPLVSRLMLSKEAKELLQQSGDQVAMPLLSLANGVEANLQRLISDEMARQPGSITVPVHVVDGPDGDLQIHIGSQVYNSVGEVPPGRVRELLQQAVDLWTDSQA